MEHKDDLLHGTDHSQNGNTINSLSTFGGLMKKDDSVISADFSDITEQSKLSMQLFKSMSNDPNQRLTSEKLQRLPDPLNKGKSSSVARTQISSRMRSHK
jgi:hypothetical protein